MGRFSGPKLDPKLSDKPSCCEGGFGHRIARLPRLVPSGAAPDKSNTKVARFVRACERGVVGECEKRCIDSKLPRRRNKLD